MSLWDFRYSFLSLSIFDEADVRGANFSFAVVSNASFHDAQMVSANFEGSEGSATCVFNGGEEDVTEKVADLVSDSSCNHKKIRLASYSPYLVSGWLSQPYVMWAGMRHHSALTLQQHQRELDDFLSDLKKLRDTKINNDSWRQYVRCWSMLFKKAELASCKASHQALKTLSYQQTLVSGHYNTIYTKMMKDTLKEMKRGRTYHSKMYTKLVEGDDPTQRYRHQKFENNVRTALLMEKTIAEKLDCFQKKSEKKLSDKKVEMHESVLTLRQISEEGGDNSEDSASEHSEDSEGGSGEETEQETDEETEDTKILFYHGSNSKIDIFLCLRHC